jgi:uncharacterized OsmC-like protein
MTQLWVERTGIRRYTGRSDRGAEVLVGSEDVEGVFTPGELLKIALAGCAGMSADAVVARRLGPDHAAIVRVTGTNDSAEDRYSHLRTELILDLAALEPSARERLLTMVHRAVDESCTIARTLTHGATVDTTITGEH